MYDYGDGPVSIYETYDEQDAIREKKRFIQCDEIYPVIFRTGGRFRSSGIYETQPDASENVSV